MRIRVFRRAPGLFNLVHRDKKSNVPSLRWIYVAIRTVAVVGALIWIGGPDEFATMGRQLSDVMATVSKQLDAAEKQAADQPIEGKNP